MTGQRSRRATAALAAALVAVALLGLAGCGKASPAAVPNQGFVSADGTVTQLAPGQRKAPVELAGTTLQGRHLDLRTLRGHVVVLNVWASWCAPCIAESPALQAVHLATEGQGVRFVGINTEADTSAALAHEKRFDVTYPSLHDESGRLLLALRGSTSPKALPSTLVLDKQGRVAARVSVKVDQALLTGLVHDVAREAS